MKQIRTPQENLSFFEQKVRDLAKKYEISYALSSTKISRVNAGKKEKTYESHTLNSVFFSESFPLELQPKVTKSLTNCIRKTADKLDHCLAEHEARLKQIKKTITIPKK